MIGRYVLPAQIFAALENVKPGAGGEIQLTDGIAALLGATPMLTHRVAAKRYDCGSKLGYLQATVVFGLRHPEIGADFGEYLQTVLKHK